MISRAQNGLVPHLSKKLNKLLYHASKMGGLKVDIGYVMLWELKNNKNFIETAKKISRLNDQGVITVQQVRNWFSKFRSANTSL